MLLYPAAPRSRAALRTQLQARKAKRLSGNGRWRRFPACSPSSELQPVVEELLQSAAEGRGLNLAVNRNMERKMEILFSPSSAGPKTRPPGVSVAVHLVELGRFVERADHGGGGERVLPAGCQGRLRGRHAQQSAERVLSLVDAYRGGGKGFWT